MIVVDGRDGGELAVRRRGLRGGQRRPAADPRLPGPQAGLRRGRGRDQLLPVPPQPGPGLLDALHQRAARPTRPRTSRSTRPGTASGADPRRWRKVAGTPTQYTIELLPANGNSSCVEGNHATMIDPATGTFRIRSTGRPRADSKLKRSLVVASSAAARSSTSSTSPTSRRPTRSTTTPSDQTLGGEPTAATATAPARNDRLQRDPVRRRRRDQGPVPHERRHPHLRHAGLRPRQRGLDRVQRPGARLDEVGGGSCGGSPVFQGPRRAGVQDAHDAADQHHAADRRADRRPRLQRQDARSASTAAANNMTVTQPAGQRRQRRRPALPANGVIYVKTGAGGCGTLDPAVARRPTPSRRSCGNLYVSGTYTSSMTLAAAERHHRRAARRAATNGDLIGPSGGNSVLGLVANNFVRVYHPVSTDGATTLRRS